MSDDFCWCLIEPMPRGKIEPACERVNECARATSYVPYAGKVISNMCHQHRILTGHDGYYPFFVMKEVKSV